MKDLTHTQRMVLGFLKEYLSKHGYPPTIREIGAHFGFLWPAARGHLKSLEKKGFIRINPSRSRGIEIIGASYPERKAIPILGRIRAGSPEIASEEIDGTIKVDETLFPGEGLFCLKVRGESMRDGGILDGDFAVVRPQNTIENGEIGVVLIGDEATIKRVFLKEKKVILKPENKEMEATIHEPSEVTILGRVIGIIRSRV
ncbi:MAG: transcriptional repressor LexA [Syntrophorhabdaceae bacterium]|nr:transcriptional repressor LexA [Syntrophorhabdaceae bacterium]